MSTVHTVATAVLCKQFKVNDKALLKILTELKIDPANINHRGDGKKQRYWNVETIRARNSEIEARVTTYRKEVERHALAGSVARGKALVTTADAQARIEQKLDTLIKKIDNVLSLLGVVG